MIRSNSKTLPNRPESVRRPGSIRISSKDTLALISNLSTMLTAGIPIMEAVESLLDESKGNVRKILLLLKEALNEGRPISEALAKAPKVFDPVTINLIRAAEESGTLETALKDLVGKIKKDIKFRDNLRSSLTYPAFVIGIFFVVLGLVLIFVMPRINKIFSGLRVELPAATKLMMSVSDTLLSNYIFILAGIGVAVVAVSVLYRLHKRALLNALLQLPGFRRLGVHIDLARFCRSLSLLLTAGITISEALELSKAVLTKKSIINAVSAMQADVLEGRPISVELRKTKEVPPIMVKMTETAEKSGTLEVMMQEMAGHFENEVSRSLKLITTMIEPVMIVVIGVLVGGMMLAVIAPMYNMMTQIRTR